MLLIRIRMMKMVVLYDFLLLVFRFLEMEGSRVQEPVERLCISTSSGGVDWQYGLGIVTLTTTFPARSATTSWSKRWNSHNSFFLISCNPRWYNYMGVSENRGTPKWIICHGNPYLNGCCGGTTIFGNPHIASSPKKWPKQPQGFFCWNSAPWPMEAPGKIQRTPPVTKGPKQLPMKPAMPHKPKDWARSSLGEESSFGSCVCASGGNKSLSGEKGTRKNRNVVKMNHVHNMFYQRTFNRQKYFVSCFILF